MNEGGQVEEGERYSDAYVEMAMAGDRMNEAVDNMEDVITESGGMSHTLDDSLNAQQLAMEAIAAAIQALQPPKPQDGEDEEKQEEEEMNQQQAEKKKQQAKEREAEREERNSRIDSKNLWQKIGKDGLKNVCILDFSIDLCSVTLGC